MPRLEIRLGKRPPNFLNMELQAPDNGYNREFNLERESVRGHREYLRELHGHDVGFPEALADWIVNCREPFRRHRQLVILSDPEHPLHERAVRYKLFSP